MPNFNLHNPHLDGDAFFWKASPLGILLSHGFTATTAEIRPLAEIFHAQGYTVAAPLLPGHGTKPEDLNKVSWRDWVAAGQKSLEKLFESCNQVWVAGESMGGVLALYLASQSPKVSGILLYAPAIRLRLSKLDLLKLYLGAPFVSEVPRDSLDGSDEWQGYAGLPLKGSLQLLRFQTATRKRLVQIQQPTLIFQGCKDFTVAPEAGEIILNGISSAVKKQHWMENSSHAIVLDAEREEVARLSMEFVEKMTGK